MARIAYTMSRFPKVSETFVADEIAAVEQRGLDVEILPLVHHHDPVTHPTAARLEARARYVRPWSPAALGALAWWLGRHPSRTLRAVWTVLAGTARSPQFLVRTIALLPQAAWFARHCQDTGVTHVHAHFATHATTNAWMIQRLTGIPYSFTAHAHDIYIDTTFLDRKICDSAVAVVISEYGRERMVACAPGCASRIQVLHLGVDLTEATARRERRAARRVERDRATQLLCVARLDATKGHPTLLAAVDRLVRDGRDIELTLIGEGDERSAIEARIAELGLGDRVRLLGARTHEQVFDAMEAADVVVSASVESADGDAEGIPVTLMEAMAIGVPVVATRTAGVPELVTDGESGVLVDQHDAAGLAAAIAGLLDEPDRARRLAEGAARRVAESFDRDRVVDQLVELLVPGLGTGKHARVP